MNSGKNGRLALILLLLAVGLTELSAQRRMIVVNAETKVPVRDVQVFTDNGQNTQTAWDGTFALPDSFSRISFRHPQYDQRFILKSELHSDTVWLLPNQNALGEVIIWGQRRSDERMRNILKPSPQQELLAKMPKAIPQGLNVLALAGWLFDNTIGKSLTKRSQRKKALKEVRKKEEEYQRKWDMLRDTTAYKKNTE